MSSNKISLFDENSDEDDGNVNLTINKNYAQRYEEWREAEIKQNLINKYGDADEQISSSSSEDEDDTEDLRKVLNKDFFEVISSLKTKDPKIYDKEVEFFKTEKESADLDPLQKKKDGKSKDKPVYLRDYERKLITERGGELSDDDSDAEEKLQRPQSPSYVEEQRLLKESFKKALQDGDSEDEGDLLQKKEKTKEEKEKEEEDYIQWLKGEKEALPDKDTENKLKPLQNLWNDPSLDDGEKFLRDYILNKRYLEEGDRDDGNVTDDDYEDEYMNQFERKYNFRFEEPDKDFLKRFPRTMENSLRKKDTRRKEKRDSVKQRKEEERLKKKEELKLLKALKRKEIMEKIAKIKQITGNDQLGLDPEELEGDFDPEEHDRKMRELFNDDYYGGADDAEDEDGLNLPPLEEELIDDDNTNWDEWDGTDKIDDAAQEENNAGGESYINGPPHCEDPDFNMDCDYDPTAESLRREEKAAGRQSSREKRKLKRQSRFGRLVRKEKPVFDPNDKTFQQYVDEYYGMDYEDLIGDIPCRFKYKNVVPNNFGLTIEEILAADDKELNQWASIKKTYSIRSDHVERNEAKIYAQKALDEELKRKIIPSLYRHENENLSNGSERKKKKKKHSEDYDNGEETANTTQDNGSLDQSIGENGSSGSKKEKKMKKKADADEAGTADISLNEDVEDVSEPAEDKKKKKKKKNKTDTSEIDDGNNVVEISEINPENPSESKGKKKKKKKKPNVSSDLSKSIQNHEINAENKSNTNNESKSPADLNKKRKRQDNNQAHNHVNKKARKSFDQGNKSKKNFKKGNRNQKGNDKQEIELSDARLKAYGIHPKRFRNKLKYGPQQ